MPLTRRPHTVVPPPLNPQELDKADRERQGQLESVRAQLQAEMVAKMQHVRTRTDQEKATIQKVRLRCVVV